ncbi:MAG: transcription termination factor NusA, partial [Myxococcota bacterium]
LAEHAEQARKQDREFGELLGIQQARAGVGRIAAQTAKQVIIKRVSDAERERIFNEFKDRQGEIVSGIVRRFERGSNIIVELERDRRGDHGSQVVEAILPPREQTPRESYRPGDRIVAFLKKIDREARGPQLVLSRTDSGLLVKLFEMEVPEIYEGIVRIVAAAREPGARSKIAVSSRDSDVDPVGACVGMKGSRVQAVVQELRGEKIDIVPFSRDPARFVCDAISPAEPARVVIDEGNATMELVVPDQKLSLAIGRRGQNVRLASQRTGWKLDIVSESRFQQMEEDAMSALARLGDEDLARNLYRMGFRTLDEVQSAPTEELLTVEGIEDESIIETLREKATAGMEDLRKEWVQHAATLPQMPTDHERLLLIRGVNEQVATALEKGGYGTLTSIESETDIDRLAIKSGLGAQRATALQEAVRDFVTNDLPGIEAGVAVAKEKADAEAEAARVAAEAEEAAKTAAAEALARATAASDDTAQPESAS